VFALLIGVYLGVRSLGDGGAAGTAPPPTPAQLEAALIAERKLFFPGVADSKELPVSDWPISFRGLVWQDAADAWYGSITYEDGTKGYIAQYEIVGSTFFDVYLYYAAALGKNNGWNVIYGARNDSIVLYEAENRRYEASVTLRQEGQEGAVSAVLALREKAI
jgi:hypothetical protein